MMVRCFWPDCNYGVVKRGQRINAFWIEATPEEAEAHILPYLPPDVADLARHRAAQYEHLAAMVAPENAPPRPFCFLVGADGKVWLPLKPTYPDSHMWNAYSPFGLFEPLVLDSMEGVRDLKPPQNVTWLGLHDEAEAEDT